MPDLDSSQLKQTESEARRASDLLFVRRMVSGDGAAWREFIDTYTPLIRARAADVAHSFGIVDDESAIDDATADVFTALLHNETASLRAFDGRSRLGTYLAVIATRCATRCFAAKRRQASQCDLEQLENATIDSASREPGEQISLNEESARVRDVVAGLPTKQREVVRLFHLQGHSYVEISRRLGMPMGSVGTTLKRAEAKIRELLEPD